MPSCIAVSLLGSFLVPSLCVYASRHRRSDRIVGLREECRHEAAQGMDPPRSARNGCQLYSERARTCSARTMPACLPARPPGRSRRRRGLLRQRMLAWPRSTVRLRGGSAHSRIPAGVAAAYEPSTAFLVVLLLLHLLRVELAVLPALQRSWPELRRSDVGRALPEGVA